MAKLELIASYADDTIGLTISSGNSDNDKDQWLATSARDHFPAGAWHHLTITYDDVTKIAALYENGEWLSHQPFVSSGFINRSFSVAYSPASTGNPIALMSTGKHYFTPKDTIGASTFNYIGTYTLTLTYTSLNGWINL